MATEALETIEDSGPTLGRPTVYTRAHNRLARNLSLLGATDEEMADAFAISTVTLYAWKNRHPSFLKAINAGKLKADAHIASRLYKRAAGYSHPDTKVMIVDNQIEKIETTKHYPPDTQAAKMWLTNRRPDLWKDRSNVDVTSNGQTISQLAAAAWAFGEQLRAQPVQTIEAPDAQKLLSDPTEPA